MPDQIIRTIVYSANSPAELPAQVACGSAAAVAGWDGRDASTEPQAEADTQAPLASPRSVKTRQPVGNNDRPTEGEQRG